MAISGQNVNKFLRYLKTKAELLHSVALFLATPFKEEVSISTSANMEMANEEAAKTSALICIEVKVFVP